MAFLKCAEILAIRIKFVNKDCLQCYFAEKNTTIQVNGIVPVI